MFCRAHTSPFRRADRYGTHPECVLVTLCAYAMYEMYYVVGIHIPMLVRMDRTHEYVYVYGVSTRETRVRVRAYSIHGISLLAYVLLVRARYGEKHISRRARECAW